jgi:hypothetical protein
VQGQLAGKIELSWQERDGERRKALGYRQDLECHKMSPCRTTTRLVCGWPRLTGGMLFTILEYSCAFCGMWEWQQRNGAIRSVDGEVVSAARLGRDGTRQRRSYSAD